MATTSRRKKLLGEVLVESGLITQEQLAEAMALQKQSKERLGRVLLGMGIATLRKVVDDAPVVRLVNVIIVQALRQRASDIHIEPQETRVRVRYRIDGALYVVMTPPAHIHAAIISRIKIMAEMDIAERRLPQDGRIQLKVENKEIDLRVSTIPTVFGEKVVMRSLDKSQTLVSIERVGLIAKNRTRSASLLTQ